MGIVAGLDSSSEFTRIVVCDADTGAVLRQGYAAHPVEPRPPSRSAGVAALARRGREHRAGSLEGVQAIGVSAQQHGLVPLDAAGQSRTPGAARQRQARAGRRRRSDRRAGRPAGVGRGRRRGAAGRAARWPSCAGWRATSRTAPPARRRGAAAARLAGVAAARPARPADDRPRRRLRHRLLVGGAGVLPARSGRAGARAPGRAARGARPGRGRRDDPGGAADLRRAPARPWPRRSGWASGSGDAVVSLGASGFGDGRAPRGAGRPDGHDHLARRRHRDAPAGRAHPQRRTGVCAAPPSCWAPTSTGCPTWR